MIKDVIGSFDSDNVRFIDNVVVEVHHYTAGVRVNPVEAVAGVVSNNSSEFVVVSDLAAHNVLVEIVSRIGQFDDFGGIIVNFRDFSRFSEECCVRVP